MANRIGGRPYKKRLLPGLGYPIPLQNAGAPFTLSGSVSLAGAITPAGNLLIELPAQGGDPAPLPHLGLLLAAGAGGPFSLTPTAAAALAATLTPAGALSIGLALSGSATLAATLAPAGTIALGLGLAGNAPLAGVFGAAGDTQYFGPFTTSGNASLSGTFGASGDVSATIEFPISGNVSLSGGFSADADPSLGIGLSGGVSLAGSLLADAEPDISIGLGGAVSLAGAFSAAGAASYGDPFELDAPLDASFTGAFSATGTIEATIGVAQGGDPAPLPHLGLLLAATGGPFTLSGDVSIGGTFDADGVAETLIALAGTVQMSGAFSADAEPGIGIGLAGDASLAGAFSADGEFESTIAFDLAGSVALSGAFAADGEPQLETLFEISGTVALSGSLTTFGDVLATETPIIIPGVGFQDFAAAGGLKKPEKKAPRLKAPKAQRKSEDARNDPFVISGDVAMFGAMSFVVGDVVALPLVIEVRGLLRTEATPPYPQLQRENCSHCGAPMSAHRQP